MKNYLPLLLAGILMTGCSPSQSKSGITEAQIHNFMDEQGAAIRRFDPEPVCNGYAPDYRQKGSVQFTGKDNVTEIIEKPNACASARASAEILRKADAKGLKLNFTDTIENIDIAGDGKSATVRYRTVATINGRPFVDGMTTDTLVLVNGKILNRGGEGQSRVDAATFETVR